MFSSIGTRFLNFCLVSFATFSFSSSFAEPWLANRYAQNCASCHAPGRVNVPASDRRCTLSCQGCHVNPNGGGIRNQYGIWNQKYWLFSSQASWWRLGGGKPEISAKQEYAKPNLQNYIDNNAPKDAEKRKLFIQEIVENGIPYKTTQAYIPESEYDRHKGAFEKEFEPNYSKFIAQVPARDPLRGKRNDDILIGGGELRYFHIEKTVDGGDKASSDLLMAADLGVQVTPIKKFSLVLESLFANGTKTEFFQGFTQASAVRSAYFMIDDLPYNTYLMSGLYRPMFGNYDPDHNSLISTFTGLGYGAIYKATTIGAAPNVPFLNVHMFQGNSSTGNTETTNAKGTGFNLGARWVTLGASATLSYFDTQSEVSGSKTSKKMTSLALGGMYKNWIPNLDFVRVQRQSTTSIDEGYAGSFQLKYRMWREMYGMFNIAQANTTRFLQKGKSVDTSYGIKSFLLPGMELEVLLINRKDDADAIGAIAASTSDKKYLQAQFHLFF